jgi:hypothetical protein
LLWWLKNPEASKNYKYLDVGKFKSPSQQCAGAFVLAGALCAKIKVQNLRGLRHYTSGKPYVSSGFSYNSDPKPCQPVQLQRSPKTDAKKPT